MAEDALRIEAAPADASDAPDAREHRESVRRLRRVLGVGVILWNAVGIPNDVVVTDLFGVSYREFLISRIVSTACVMGGWAVLFFRPSPRTFRIAEAIAFFGATMGLAALEHGLRGPTPIFLSCTLLAQGIAVPRPWREGLVSLGLTWLGYVLGLGVTYVLTHRLESDWHDATSQIALVRHLFFALLTATFAVISGDASFALRRRAREAQRVGSYRLRERLGGGAMGEVWRAHHPGLGQDVAVKLAKDERAAARLAVEADLLAEIAHPNVVRLLDRGRTDAGLPFLAMELARGETLEARVAQGGPLAVEAALAVTRDLCRALAALHARGIVHRDVKPANVIVAERGGEVHATLIDFGVAARAGERATSAVGSPRFMAPEQRGGAIEPRADLFACAAVAFFALTGKSPLDTEGEPSTAAIGAALAAHEVPDAIRRALALDPTARPESAAAMRDALA
jgi:serine/threonine-protein kinase